MHSAKMKKRAANWLWTALLLIAVAPTRAADAPAAMPVELKPGPDTVLLQGRWDSTDPDGPRCAFPASGFVTRFSGTRLGARLKEAWAGKSQDQLQVFVDGKPGEVVKLQAGESVVTLADNLPPGEHTVRVVKRTEASVGTLQLQALLLPADTKALPPPKRPARSIEVIGDSISCGYGNEGKSQNEHFSPDTENACLTYGFLTAEYFAADYTCVAWSGKKMWPNNTVGEFYDRALPADPKSAWKFDAPAPDVVLINLATNDFGGKENPDEAGWTTAYKAFITRLRKHYPKADIYLATGSMMSDDWPAKRKTLTTLKGYLDKVVADLKESGDERLHRIDFDPQNAGKNGLGADWHPNVKTHRLMADKFIAALKTDLGWKAD